LYNYLLDFAMQYVETHGRASLHIQKKMPIFVLRRGTPYVETHGRASLHTLQAQKSDFSKKVRLFMNVFFTFVPHKTI